MRVSGVDGLRGAATVMIAVGHAWFLGGMADLDSGGYLVSVIASSSIAVDIFFVLSAVILLAPLASGEAFGQARRFYQRRVARLLPLYLLVLVAAMLVSRALGFPAALPPSREGWQLLGSHLVFAQNGVYGNDLTNVGFGVDTVVWTLCVEWGFYLVLPWIAGWWVRHPWLGLVGGLALARGWTALALDAPHEAQQRLLLETPTYAGHFAVGLTLAVVLFSPRYRGVADALRPLARPLKLVGLGWLLAFMVAEGNRGLAGELHEFAHVTGTLPALPGIALLVAGAALAPSRLLDGRVARYLADTSYAVYLLHLMAIYVGVHLGLHGPRTTLPFLLLLAGPVAGTFVVARLVHRWIEVPARRWVNGLGRPSAPAPVPVPVSIPAQAPGRLHLPAQRHPEHRPRPPVPAEVPLP